MRKILALFVSMLLIASCTDPFDASSIWDKLNELENKIDGSADIPNEMSNNKIYYTTVDGEKMFPSNTEPSVFGAIIISNIYENGVGILTFDDDITSIDGFGGCTQLASITIPNSVTSIGYEAFYGCTGLTSITIPNSVTSIGNTAFSNCSGLTSITIPNSVTSIGYNAFLGCSGLTSITIPNSVTSIAYFAFRGCSGLTSITIPNSVTSIGDWAFEGCDGLEEVHITDLDAWKNISFGSYANPLYYGAKLYLNGVEVTDY